MSVLSSSNREASSSSDSGAPKVRPPLGRVRVLHVNPGNLYGGVETILVTLARLRHLSPGMEPRYALCYEGRLSRELMEAGVAVDLIGEVRISHPWTVSRARRRLSEIVGREAFDLVICHSPWSLAIFGDTVHGAGQKLAMWAHIYHTGQHWLERLARRVKPDVVIASSHYAEGGARRLFPTVPSEVVYPPVELIEMPEREIWRSKVRREHGVKDDTVVIIQVGRMEGAKGHGLHLEALQKLKDLETRWVCWMVGGPQRSQEQDYLRKIQAIAR